MVPEPKYIYDNGFSQIVYICTECKSYKLTQKVSGGFTPPTYKCNDCGATVHAPSWQNAPFIDKEVKEELKVLRLQYN